MFLLLRGGVTGNGIAGNFDWEAEKKNNWNYEFIFLNQVIGWVNSKFRDWISRGIYFFVSE